MTRTGSSICDARGYSIPFLHEFKHSGSVPLPGGIQVSGSAQLYLYPAQEAVGGSLDAWGGTHQGALEGARPYNGNIDYIVPSSAFGNTGAPVLGRAASTIQGPIPAVRVAHPR